MQYDVRMVEEKAVLPGIAINTYTCRSNRGLRKEDPEAKIEPVLGWLWRNMSPPNHATSKYLPPQNRTCV